MHTAILIWRRVVAMCKSICIVLVLIMFSFAESIWIDPVLAPGSSNQDYLQYDDGTAYWLTWDGQWRGVWFNTDDFIPGMSGFLLEYTEYWMYHHSSYPWDISVFYAEVWSGDHTGPVELLDLNLATAIHYSAAIVYHPLMDTETDFWVIENTIMSSGGWPSILADGSPPSVDHSFYSDDFLVWEPRIMDYLIRSSGEFQSSLENSTWGGIKAVF